MVRGGADGEGRMKGEEYVVLFTVPAGVTGAWVLWDRGTKVEAEESARKLAAGRPEFSVMVAREILVIRPGEGTRAPRPEGEGSDKIGAGGNA
jgi:hypothetical protein